MPDADQTVSIVVWRSKQTAIHTPWSYARPGDCSVRQQPFSARDPTRAPSARLWTFNDKTRTRSPPTR